MGCRDVGWYDPEDACEPRPRAVPEVGPGENVDPRGLVGRLVDSLGSADGLSSSLWAGEAIRAGELLYSDGERVWSRGFNYEAIGEGHYDDE